MAGENELTVQLDSINTQRDGLIGELCKKLGKESYELNPADLQSLDRDTKDRLMALDKQLIINIGKLESILFEKESAEHGGSVFFAPSQHRSELENKNDFLKREVETLSGKIDVRTPTSASPEKAERRVERRMF